MPYNGKYTERAMSKIMKSGSSQKRTAKKEMVEKGVYMTKKKATMARKKPGGSNVGKYTKVASSEFAGPSGGAPKGSYPINTRKRAKAALAYARNAPNPAGIKRKVRAKYPSLGKKSNKNPY